MGDTEAYTLGAVRRARTAHVFKYGMRTSLCGRVWAALVWNWYPGNPMTEAECDRCLERWLRATKPAAVVPSPVVPPAPGLERQWFAMAAELAQGALRG